MKKKDRISIHTMKPDELTKLIRVSRAKLIEILIQKEAGKLKNVREAKILRKKIATLLTVANEKEIV